jgi:hypothetical protein
LATIFPDIAQEADGWDPTLVSSSSGKKVSWKCAKGHKFAAAIYSRTGKGKSGCPICSNRQLIVGENDLKTTHPEIAGEAFGWDPATVSSGAGRKKYKWQCPKGHVYLSYVYSRTNGIGCSVCANRTIQVGINDLKTTNLELSQEAVGWNPEEYVAGSSEKVNWICPLKHEYEASIVNRTSRGTGCPVCANKVVLVGFNDIATTHPKLAKEANGWDPRTEYSGSHKKLSWKCNMGHTWNAIAVSRARGNNCSICSNHFTQSGTNDLATTHPQIAKEAYGWDPSEFNAGSKVKKNWKCTKGHIWDASINTRMRGKGEGCPICSNHRVLAGFNDLATTHPHLLEQVHEWDPSKVSAGSGLKKNWKCPEGHIWKTVISHRTGSRETGCPSCAKFGYDFNKDGFLYFLKHEDWKMLQIGITNVPEIRLAQHRRNGWEVVELRGPMDGLIARDWETSILQMLKRHGATLASGEVAGKFDGYTEAWIMASFPASSLHELMEKVKDDEEQPKGLR